MMKSKSINWFIGKIEEVIQKHPELKTLNEVAGEVLTNQNNSLENEFHCDVALQIVSRNIRFKKVIQKNKSITPISLAA